MSRAPPRPSTIEATLRWDEGLAAMLASSNLTQSILNQVLQSAVAQDDVPVNALHALVRRGAALSTLFLPSRGVDWYIQRLRRFDNSTVRRAGLEARSWVMRLRFGGVLAHRHALATEAREAARVAEIRRFGPAAKRVVAATRATLDRLLTCHVCTERCEPTDLMALACGHPLCDACAIATKRSRCPMCRAPFYRSMLVSRFN